MIFDMDGLIFDSERLFMNKRAGVLEKYGYVHRESDYVKTLGVSGDELRYLMAEIYGDAYPFDAVNRESRALFDAHVAKYGLPIKPGIVDLLKWLKAHAIPCCVATATARIHSEKYLKDAGLLPYFDFIVTGDEVAHSKPDPEIFLTCCTKKAVAPQNALVLEDSENGILAADAGGIPVICIPDLKVPEAQIAKRTALILNRADELISVFEKL